MENTPLKVIIQGDPVVSHDYGYIMKRGDGVVAFYVDLVTKGCHISGWSSGEDGPEIIVEDGRDDSEATLIAFPEFKGYDVHSCNCAKYTIAVCLTDIHNEEL